MPLNYAFQLPKCPLLLSTNIYRHVKKTVNAHCTLFTKMAGFVCCIQVVQHLTTKHAMGAQLDSQVRIKLC